MIDEIRKLLRAGDFFAAVESIQLAGSPSDIAGRYASLVRASYWEARDLAAVVSIGRAGILYCLSQSCLPGISTADACHLRSIAKGLAYDVGSFTWPGWEEPGIDPTPTDLAAGRECALLNLRLAIELNKPADRISMAHWLVGAHALAEGNFALAEEHFLSAVDVLPEGEPGLMGLWLYSKGCLSVARLCRDGNNAAAHADFSKINAQLAE